MGLQTDAAVGVMGLDEFDELPIAHGRLLAVLRANVTQHASRADFACISHRMRLESNGTQSARRTTIHYRGHPSTATGGIEEP